MPGQVVCRDVRLVLERIVAWGVDAGGPPEVVERHGIDARLREPQGELLVVRVEAADIGEDDDAGTGRLGRARTEREEAVAVIGGQDQRGSVEGAAGDRRDGRPAVEVEAHAEMVPRAFPTRASEDGRTWPLPGSDGSEAIDDAARANVKNMRP